MKQNIQNNNSKKIKTKLYNGNYYDFALFNGESVTYSKTYIDSLSLADFSSLNIQDNTLYSDIVWDKAINNGVELNNIGFTGVDNGLISFRKDRITNEKFLELYLNSQLQIESGDTRLFLNPVTGNTLEYIYPMELIENLEEKYLSCRGGFYQGFFKLYGHDYQVLPEKIENDWIFHFELRPRSDYNQNQNIVNYTHPNNKGIFFFLGTRAENKFWPFYDINEKTLNKFKKINAQTEGYFAESDAYDITKNNIVSLENKWVKEEEIKDKNTSNEIKVGNYSFFLDDYLASSTILKINSDTTISCNDYFQDDYFNDECTVNNNKFVEDDYIGEGVLIDFNGYKDSEGRRFNEWGTEEIESDNKFLLFDRTPEGFTTSNWIEGTKVALTKKRNLPPANYFLLFNHTETGYTTTTINKYLETNSYDYNLYKDIRDNVFALRITDNGQIGYRYGVFNCENDDKYELIEEYSKENIIKINEWNTINVRCTKILNKMKLYFYVNGYLVFISKDLKPFNFKELDDTQERQEGVPYNISLGGGSLGLLETILPDYYSILNYTLPIEKDFCGTFIGDIKTFKMYEGFIDYSSILNYLS